MDDRPARLEEERLSGRTGERVRHYGGTPASPQDTRTAEYASREGAGPEGDRDPDRRVQEIRAQIEQTREDMSETIDAIQEKLRPGNLVAQATDSVKRATTERMKSMGRQTEEIFQSEGGGNVLPLALIGAGAAWLLARRAQSHGEGRFRGSRIYHASGDYAGYGDYGDRREVEGGKVGQGGVVDRIRHNPVPAALVGAGLAWLALAEDNGHDSEYGAAAGSRTRGDWATTKGPGAVETGTGSEGAEGEPLADRGRNMAGRLESRAEEITGTVRESARRTTRRAGNGLQRLLRDNPLLAGAAAAAIGAAVGVALPETERENEWMGEAKEAVVDRAQDVARSAADRARDAAGDLVTRTVTGSD